jgi:hypothetical protein
VDKIELRSEIKKLVEKIGRKKVRYFFVMSKVVEMRQLIREAEFELRQIDKVRLDANKFFKQIVQGINDKIMDEDLFTKLIFYKVKSDDPFCETNDIDGIEGIKKKLKDIKIMKSKIAQGMNDLEKKLIEDNEFMWSNISYENINAIASPMLKKEIFCELKQASGKIFRSTELFVAITENYIKLEKFYGLLISSNEEDIDENLEDLIRLEDLIVRHCWLVLIGS